MKLAGGVKKTGSMTIQEASRLVDVPRHTLRFWEKELGGGLVPQRTSGGQRRYTEEQVITARLVKGLREKGYRLAQIKEMLGPRPAGEQKDPTNESIDRLVRSVAEIVSREVFRFLNLIPVENKDLRD